MGYLLTKQADVVYDKTPLGIPYVKPADSETAGNILGGLVAGGGLAGTTAIGNSLYKKKLIKDRAFTTAVEDDLTKILQKLDTDKPVHKWLSNLMFKPMPDNPGIYKTRLLGRGAGLASGFKHLKLPGKLKALGLLAAPIAAGGLVDAAVD